MFRFSEFLFCDFAWIRGIKYSKLKIPLSMTEYAIALFYKTSNNSSVLSCLLTFILIQRSQFVTNISISFLQYICCGSILSLVQIFFSFVSGYCSV